MNKILYLTYDGLLEPLGYSQIICYLKDLSNKYSITVISLEKNKDLIDRENYNNIKKILDSNNIKWKYLKYNGGVLKYLNIINLFFYTFLSIIIYKYKVIHARSYIPASIAYFIKLIFKTDYFFDMRGLWVDERIDWKLWKKNSFQYLIFKFLEKKIIYNSHTIISLTKDGLQEIKNRYKDLSKNINLFVIPTSVNIVKNHEFIKNYNKFINVTHLGAIGTRYNFDLCLSLFKKLNINDDYFLNIINKGEHNAIKKYLKKFEITKSNYLLEYVRPYDINKIFKYTDFGLFFPVPGTYLKAYFPTKLGEFLSNGVPIITCKINNDVDSIILNNNVGIILEDCENINYQKLKKKITTILNDDNLKQRCINVAKNHFDISKAVNNYSKIYNNFFT